MKPHLYIFSLVCILVMGLLGEKKKPKGIKPMKCRSVFPPSYKCITPKIKTDREISQGVKAYTINAFKGLKTVRTKDGPMQYLPSEKVSEISYHIKNEFAYKNQLSA